MRYNGIIQRKLSLLEQQLLNLEASLATVDLNVFSNSWEKRSIAERALQVSIEILIDIAERIIAIEGSGPR